ncbi:BMP family lipoprotein [Chloroflexus aggregans]|uniref:Basic membrane lipoprotein n=1 Tax=Chloroflexus aggregans (strain MD-66 / DSM 9485) TaxID=326427 RepID=B8GAZ7_CHLAD|nr:BMP family ABC transporter substrate-binding protein [Chloroflexus aggregans]ACL26597.1 basic membrane lipoprotein [Chloroflexus aggregans DSM 9485]
MRKTLLTLIALLALLLPVLTACGQPAAQPTATPAPTAAPTAAPTTAPTDSSKPRIALVTDLGKVNDGTFNEFAHLGALRAAQEFGLEYKYIETQAQADYEKNIQTFVDEGFDVIITVGFLIADATKKFAAEHPDIIFIGVDQFYEPGTVTDNLVGLQFREDQAGFLAGALAGMMTKTNTIGIVAGQEIPPVKRFKNGFDNGARYVNPNINLLGVYLPTFIDPALGASTAQQMIGEGADVIFGAGGPTGSGAIKEAAARGVFVIGVDQDEYVTTFANGSAPGADKILSSAIKRVDVAVYDQVKAVVNGTFKGNGIALYEAANGGIGYADYHDTANIVPPEVKARMEQILAELTNGTLTTGVDPVSGDVDPATIPAPKPFRASDVKLPRIALVTDLGKVNDGTFNQSAHLGALRAAQEFGLEYKYIETQAQADYEKNIQTFIDEGFDVIITVGFLIADATKKFAAEHPDIIFIGVDQFYEPGTVTDNLVGLQFREDQAGFLVGALAGMMTKTNTVGVVAGQEIPPVKRFKNAFDNGARYVNPNINLLGVYLPTFIDPALGASTAQQMIGEGADVIMGAGGPTGSGAIKEAAARGVYVIGVDQDEYFTTFAGGTAPGADRLLTSALKRVDVAVYDQVKAVVNGTFKGNGIAMYEAANGGIGYADYHDTADDVPDAVKRRMEEILAALTKGELTTGVDPVSGDIDPATIPAPKPFQP